MDTAVSGVSALTWCELVHSRQPFEGPERAGKQLSDFSRAVSAEVYVAGAIGLNEEIGCELDPPIAGEGQGSIGPGGYGKNPRNTSRDAAVTGADRCVPSRIF